MSRIRTIAREDARRAFRSRLLWGAIVLLGAMFLPSTGTSARPDLYSLQEYLLILPRDLMTFSLVVVAAVGYGAVVNERIAGTDRFVLGLPATRRDLVLGKLLSRIGIVVAALAVILVIANVLVVRGYGRPHLAPFWVMGGWMLVYVAVWSAVTIGYSAVFDSPYWTLAALVVTHVVFSFNFGVWSLVVRPVFALLFTGSMDPPSYETLANAPLWLRVTERLNPLVDFWNAMRWSIEFVGPGSPTGGPLPHVLGTAIFLLLGILPLVYGLRRFERTELGVEQSQFQLGDWLWRSLGQVSRVLTESAAIRRLRTGSNRIWCLTIADLRHMLQNWIVLGALVVTLLLAGPSLWGAIDANSIFSLNEVLGRVYMSFTLPVMILGIAVGHNAVVGERTAGTVRLVLGMPVTRRDLFLGKLLSRVGIVVAMLLSLLLLAEVLVVTRLGELYLGAFIALAGWTLLYGIIWTVVTVSISAAVSSRYRSLAAIGATYFAFGTGRGLWGLLVRPAVAFVGSGRFSADEFVQSVNSPMWFRYLDNLNPFIALETVRGGLYEVTGYGTEFTELNVMLFVYSLLVLISFAAVVLGLCVRRFNHSDLG